MAEAVAENAAEKAASPVVDPLASARDRLASGFSFDDQQNDEGAGAEKETPEVPEKVEAKEAVEPTAAKQTPAPKEQVEPRPQVNDQWDKTLQRLQQATATFERASQRLEADPTPQNVKAAEKAKSRLDQLLEAKDDDIDPYAGLKVVAGEFKGHAQKIEREHGESRQALASLQAGQQALQEKLYRMEWAAQHPTLADKYDSIVEKVREKVKPIAEAGGGRIPQPVWDQIVAEKWEATVAEFESASTEPAAGSVPVATPIEKPRATQPVKSRSGAARKPVEDSNSRYQSALDKMWTNLRGS